MNARPPVPSPAARLARLIAAVSLLSLGLAACDASDDGDHDQVVPQNAAEVELPVSAELAAETIAAAEPIAEPIAEVATAAVADVPDVIDLTDWHVADGHLGLHSLAWLPLGHQGSVPRNIEFSMDVLLRRDDLPVTGANVQVTGFMPAHGHGMVQLPQTEELGEGRYRIDGMLLHMRGSWQVRFTIVANRAVETVTFDLEL